MSRTPTLTQPKAVLFDWDNTLVDTWPTIHESMNTTLAAMGQPPWTFDETRERVRKSLREAFPEMFGERWQEARDVFYGRFRAIHLKKLAVRPGAERLIESLASRGIYLGVVSNKSGENLRRESAHLGWDGYFGGVVGATDASRDKPAVEPVELALSGSGIAPGPEVWFVGDTGIDMECAHNANCFAILVRETAPKVGEFGAFEPKLHFRDCDRLATLVRRL